MAGEGANDKQDKVQMARGAQMAGKDATDKLWKDVRGETKEKLKRNGKISKERSHKTTSGCSNEEANVTRS